MRRTRDERRCDFNAGAVSLIALCLMIAACSPAQAPDCPASRVTSITTLRESGGRVDWSHANDLIAFDAMGEDGYYDVYTMKPDGSDETCLTCGTEGLIPQRHIGNPAWHPSGGYIVFQAEKETHRGLSASATPGFGLYSDLWLVSRDGQQFVKLTDMPDTDDSGVLHPHFSPDGKRLSWSEMVEKPDLLVKGKEFGYWKLKIADISIDEAGAVLSDVREYQPGGPAFYENHGFSPDGAALIFSSNSARPGSALRNTDIFSLDLATEVVTQLTERDYNEHAHFSPDGARIVWMTDADNDGRGTDYWLMDADGSGKERLTYFNQPGCPESATERLTAADSSWGPDGKHIVAYVSTDLIRQIGRIVMITLGQ
jgi:Tol biopolymer transport system component